MLINSNIWSQVSNKLGKHLSKAYQLKIRENSEMNIISEEDCIINLKPRM
jgi:hypothetical protein